VTTITSDFGEEMARFLGDLHVFCTYEEIIISEDGWGWALAWALAWAQLGVKEVKCYPLSSRASWWSAGILPLHLSAMDCSPSLESWFRTWAGNELKFAGPKDWFYAAKQAGDYELNEMRLGFGLHPLVQLLMPWRH
jgi:hypothetical protein